MPTAASVIGAALVLLAAPTLAAEPAPRVATIVANGATITLQIRAETKVRVSADSVTLRQLPGPERRRLSTLSGNVVLRVQQAGREVLRIAADGLTYEEPAKKAE